MLFVASPPEYAAEWEWATLIPHALHRNDASRSIPAVATDSKDLSVALARTAGARMDCSRPMSKRWSRPDFRTSSSSWTVTIRCLNWRKYRCSRTRLPAAELRITVITINHSPGKSPAEAACVVTVGSSVATMRFTRVPSPSVR